MSKRAHDLLKKALIAIANNRPNLKPGTPYTLEQLTGDQYWGSLSSGQRKGLGIQFKTYVKKHGSPVQWVSETPTHCQQYQLL
ncbi:DUF1413 domain-containing protein [Pseudohalioglobus lutimaris]|uniref:Uncharacterized protein n=1 Tax=Pseudohalioglobus lutimaris TaxID=1737061 RepID=A0A2N5X0Z3_9GAMM|nr:DUF1413 domain-containing protein [Pseudohalioglobus lutimaris]PLW68151.1 hypothetical protein C0039_13225 [Pseudohalioglobus lutimaris]